MKIFKKRKLSEEIEKYDNYRLAEVLELKDDIQSVADVAQADAFKSIKKLDKRAKEAFKEAEKNAEPVVKSTHNRTLGIVDKTDAMKKMGLVESFNKKFPSVNYSVSHKNKGKFLKVYAESLDQAKDISTWASGNKIPCYIRKSKGVYSCVLKEEWEDEDILLGKKVKIRKRYSNLDGTIGTIHSYEGTNYDDKVEVERNGHFYTVNYEDIEFLDSKAKDDETIDYKGIEIGVLHTPSGTLYEVRYNKNKADWPEYKKLENAKKYIDIFLTKGEQAANASWKIDEANNLAETIDRSQEIDNVTKRTIKEEWVDEDACRAGVAQDLNYLIKDELEAVEGYNSVLATWKDAGKFPEIIAVLKDIVDEEMLHIGQLQRALELVSPNAKNIQAGAKEAEEQIVDEAEKQKEEEIEKAEEKFRDKVGTELEDSIEDIEDGEEEIVDTEIVEESLDDEKVNKTIKSARKLEDVKKLPNGKWANVGKDGKADSGTFKTKKEAEAQMKAMYANGYKESIKKEGMKDTLDAYVNGETLEEEHNVEDTTDTFKEEKVEVKEDLKEEKIEKGPFQVIWYVMEDDHPRCECFKEREKAIEYCNNHKEDKDKLEMQAVEVNDKDEIVDYLVL